MQAALINNGHDLHLHHGPIDLIINAKGPERSVAMAQELAAQRFESVLTGLVAELDVLRRPVATHCNVVDPVALRMWRATSVFSKSGFLTPMASVAGAVADEVLSAVINANPANEIHDLASVSVNNGGDIAFYLGVGETSNLGIVDPINGRCLVRAAIKSADGIGGVATSGRHGRSLSLGIADTVTVLAANAATADTAATLIANAVDLPDNPKIERVAASELDPDSDLGELPVTVHVDLLSDSECDNALQNGLHLAQAFKRQGHIEAAYLAVQSRCVATENINAINQNIELQQKRVC